MSTRVEAAGRLSWQCPCTIAPEVRQQRDPAVGVAFQRRVWQAQRVAWGLMALIVLAGLLGFLGSGPFGRRSVATPDGTLRVEYERFVRRGTRTTLLIWMQPTQPGASVLALRLAQPYLDGMRVESVFPPPRRVQVGRRHVTLDFDVDSRQPGAVTVAIHVLPAGIGARWAAVGVDAGPELGFRQWVNP
jgi:hypothetical protein